MFLYRSSAVLPIDQIDRSNNSRMTLTLYTFQPEGPKQDLESRVIRSVNQPKKIQKSDQNHKVQKTCKKPVFLA